MTINPATCSDLAWFRETGHCGGCGTDDCHPGRECGDVDHWFDHSTCDLCLHRASQGMPTRLWPRTGGAA